MPPGPGVTLSTPDLGALCTGKVNGRTGRAVKGPRARA